MVIWPTISDRIIKLGDNQTIYRPILGIWGSWPITDQKKNLIGQPLPFFTPFLMPMDCHPELNELYVTSGRVGGDPEKVLPEVSYVVSSFRQIMNSNPQAGSIFRVTGLGDGVRGLPAVEFPRNTLETLLQN